jgi:glutamine synthetase
MAGALTLDALKKAVADGSIDTVIVAFPDMQGRLIGKRYLAAYFLDSAMEETHG